MGFLQKVSENSGLGVEWGSGAAFGPQIIRPLILNSPYISSSRFCTSGWWIPFSKRRQISMIMIFLVFTRRKWAPKPLILSPALSARFWNVCFCIFKQGSTTCQQLIWNANLDISEQIQNFWMCSNRRTCESWLVIFIQVIHLLQPVVFFHQMIPLLQANDCLSSARWFIFSHHMIRSSNRWSLFYKQMILIFNQRIFQHNNFQWVNIS